MDKTKLMVSVVQTLMCLKSVKYPCELCQTGVGRKPIYCGSCKVYKKCIGIKGTLASDLDFKCARCLDTA